MAAPSVQNFQQTFDALYTKVASRLSPDLAELSTLYRQFQGEWDDTLENDWESLEKVIHCLFNLIDHLFAAWELFRKKNPPWGRSWKRLKWN